MEKGGGGGEEGRKKGRKEGRKEGGRGREQQVNSTVQRKFVLVQFTVRNCASSLSMVSHSSFTTTRSGSSGRA